MLGLTACVTTPTVSTHVSDGVHLEQYKTYGLRSGNVYESGSVKTGDQTEVGKAVEADLREELRRHGLKPQDYNPDLVFSYAAAKRQGYAGERQWPYQEGAIDLTATDTTGRIVWSSHLQAILDPSDKIHRHLKDAIQRAFKNYPFFNPLGSDDRIPKAYNREGSC